MAILPLSADTRPQVMSFEHWLRKHPRAVQISAVNLRAEDAQFPSACVHLDIDPREMVALVEYRRADEVEHS